MLRVRKDEEFCCGSMDERELMLSQGFVVRCFS